MRILVPVIVAAFALVPVQVAAQQGVLQWSDVTGSVVGSSGAPLAGLRVELVEAGGFASPVLRVALTDQQGGYSFLSVPPGGYEARVVSGLQTVSRTAFQVVAGRDSQVPGVASLLSAITPLVSSRDVLGLEGLGRPNRSSRASVAAIICALTCWFPSATRVSRSPLD